MTYFAKIRRSVLGRVMSDESGAVTVDWVVLTAAVVILAIGAITALDGGISGMVAQINSALSTAGSAAVTEAGSL